MHIDGINVRPFQPPTIVAELSANHGGNIDTMLTLISKARQCGADLVKFQAFTPAGLLGFPKSAAARACVSWRGRPYTAWELYDKAATPYVWFPMLVERCKQEKIGWFASVFDLDGLAMLEQLGCPAYKIASPELTHLPLIRHVARLGKPVIISTGMGSIPEILDAYTTAHRYTETLMMHCVSGYPTPPQEANLPRIDQIRHVMRPNIPVGFSDHTTGINVALASIVYGVQMIEKHLCLPELNTLDAAHSLSPAQFAALVSSSREVWQAMQSIEHAESERPTRNLRRTLAAQKDIKPGDRFTYDNVMCVRAKSGLPPRLFDILQASNCRAICEIGAGQPLYEHHYEIERRNPYDQTQETKTSELG